MRRAWRRQPLRALRDILLRALLGSFVALGILLILEFALRASGAAPAWNAQSGIGWRLTENMDGPANVPVGQKAFHLKTNADGLRTQLPRARGSAPRVALMGDSTTFGWGVDEGGTPSDGVALALPGVEVLNAGMPGYSTVQIAWLFETVIQYYHPDILVLIPPLHDHNWVLLSDRQQLALNEGRWGARAWLVQESRLYQWIRQRLFSLSEAPLLLPGQPGGADRVQRVTDTERADVLRQLKADLTDIGGQLVIGYLAQAGDMEHHDAIRGGELWMREFTQKEDIKIADGRACCFGDKNLLLPGDPGHLTAEGNLKAGRALGEALRKIMQGTAHMPETMLP